MKMRTKTKLYLLLALLGLALFGGALLWKPLLGKVATGILCGLSGAALGLGVTKFFNSRLEETHPQEMRQQQIDNRDERNVMIRQRAQALSGRLLQGLVMALAWVCIILDQPLWLILSLVGLYLCKAVGELALLSYYQERL